MLFFGVFRIFFSFFVSVCRHKLRLPLFPKEIDEEDESHARNDHQERPELRGRDACNELTAVVVAHEFYQEAEDSVADQINAHIVSELKFQKQERAYREHYKQEGSLVKLRGVNRTGVSGEEHAEEGIGGLAVAAARKEAAYSAEGVSDEDRAGDERERVDKTDAEPFAENGVARHKYGDAADKSAEEGNSRAEIEAVCGIFNILVGRLEESRRAEAERDRNDSVVIDEIGELCVDLELLRISVKDGEERDNNADGDHHPVHMDRNGS